VDDKALYEKASKRVEEIKGFYSHLMTYALVNLALFILNLITSPSHFWFYWPLFGWGIGVLAHAGSVFGPGRLWGAQWEERKIKELMDKDRSGQ